ncbi:hypothetical protein AVEN_221512-1 [Araneus ventricosus]|uniref:Uncharacterized protein n=1 Tax=Araneus ventricosus TaxID=182803 RepID=A0A4Y2E2C0_ARAVE|nr:hypothetical protein AVEN_221512-1 [Araneus ventricosus]
MKSRKQFKINRIRIESNDVLAKSTVTSQSLSGRVVRASGLEAVGREFYPRLCSYSVFAIVCNEFDVTNLLQVRRVVTSKLTLTCCKLVSSLHACHVIFVGTLQICRARLLRLSQIARTFDFDLILPCHGKFDASNLKRTCHKFDVTTIT